MGDPKRPKRKYSRPSHPWQRARIEEEKEIVKEYGILRKTEIWKMNSKLKRYKKQAKRLITSATSQAEIEKKQLMDALIKLNLIKENATLDDVLSLKLKDLLERRLQTIVFKKGLARTVKQARQFIVHGHIMIKDHKQSSPSHLVVYDQEVEVTFNALSTLADEEHPERKDAEVKKELIKEHEKINPPKQEVVEIKGEQ